MHKAAFGDIPWFADRAISDRAPPLVGSTWRGVVTSPNDLPRTVGELRASGHIERGVRDEIRANLLVAPADGSRDVWPGIFGFGDTVLPQGRRTLIAGHDFILLGERGQGKGAVAAVAGGPARRVDARDRRGRTQRTSIQPGSRRESIRRVAESGDDLPIAWRHRSERYREAGHSRYQRGRPRRRHRPIKVAEGRSLGDPKPSPPRPDPTGTSRHRRRQQTLLIWPSGSRCRCST